MNTARELVKISLDGGNSSGGLRIPLLKVTSED